VRVTLPNAPPEMRLGATVTGRVELPAQNVVELPGSSLFEKDGKPAVWVFDPAMERSSSGRSQCCDLTLIASCSRAVSRKATSW
jgi:hypothetical protein